ncbi:MAG: pyroglutamyl-peptidase I [Parvibaculaceae bacterium]
MSTRPILVTGFEPFGGMASNPSLLAARELDGRSLDGWKIIGRELPVSFARISERLDRLIEQFAPAAVIGLGLAPGSPALRLERVAVNLADFDIPDNDGSRLSDLPVSRTGPAARFSTLPLADIRAALLDAGVPAILSPSAGTYLCNACLYCLLELIERRNLDTPAGFIHVPMTPEQVAGQQRNAGAAADAPAPSMDLSRIIAGVEVAIRETARALSQGRAAARA